jgi:hypothetical protein
MLNKERHHSVAFFAVSVNVNWLRFLLIYSLVGWLSAIFFQVVLSAQRFEKVCQALNTVRLLPGVVTAIGGNL